MFYYATQLKRTPARIGMAFSRIGLWSFDLIQVKQLQVSLEEHPERNTL